jgi:hypothetical protein
MSPYFWFRRESKSSRDRVVEREAKILSAVVRDKLEGTREGFLAFWWYFFMG